MNEQMAAALDCFREILERKDVGWWDFFVHLFVLSGLLEDVDLEFNRKSSEPYVGAIRLRCSSLAVTNDSGYHHFDLRDCVHKQNNRFTMLTHVDRYEFYAYDYQFTVVNGKITAEHNNPEIDDSFTLHTDGHKLDRALVA